MYCKLIQWRLSCHLDSDTEPAGFLGRHLQNCTRCRRQYQKMRQISQQLQTQDPELPDFAEKQLQRRIMAHLPDTRFRVTPSPRQVWRFPIITAASLAAILLIAAALWWIGQPFGSNPVLPTRADLAWLDQLMNTNIDSFSDRLIRQPTQESLEKELNNLTRDVEKGVQFLAACLPDA